PLAENKQEVRDDYKARWQELHRYVHPSAYLAGRMIDESALHVLDNFDQEWALETVDIASCVMDLIWLAVLEHYPPAFVLLDKLSPVYPILHSVFERHNQEDRTRSTERYECGEGAKDTRWVLTVGVGTPAGSGSEASAGNHRCGSGCGLLRCYGDGSFRESS